MSKFKKGKKSKELPPISTASLPDIVFMLLCFFMVVTKMRETDIKVRTKVPQISELRKIENKSLNSFVFIGPPSNQYQAQLGNAPRIQLNDAFAKPTDIMAFATQRRADVPPAQHNEMTVAMKVDGEVKMGLVTDVKTELRKANIEKGLLYGQTEEAKKSNFLKKIVEGRKKLRPFVYFVSLILKSFNFNIFELSKQYRFIFFESKTVIIFSMSKNINKSQIGSKSNNTQKNIGASIQFTKNPIDAYFGKYTVFLVLGLLVLLATWAYGSFWFTDKVFLFKDIGSDAINAVYPMYYWNAENWELEGKISFWSFSTGVGQNVLLQNMGDPFVWLMYIAGKDSIIYLLGIIEPLKIVLAGWAFYAYFRTMKLNYLSSMIGALCYAFSGFMMIGSGWYVFTIEGLYFALLLLTFEQYLQKSKWIFFPIVICLMGIWQPVDVFLMAILIAIYGTLRILDENKMNWIDLLKRLSFLGFLGVIGVIMGAFLILPTLELLTNSPRVLGESSFFDTLRSKSMFEMANSDLWETTKARWISTDLLKDENNNFRGAMNYLEAPATYAGLPVFILVPIAFELLSNKKRLLYGIWLFIFIIPLLFPFFRYTFWLYTGDYYRLYSLFVIIPSLFLSVNAIHQLLEGRKFPWYGFGIGALLILYMLFSITNSNVVVVNEVSRNITLMFALGYIVCIGLMSLPRLRNQSILFFILLLFLELGSGAYSVHNNRILATSSEFTKEKIGYNDYTRDAVNWIKSKDSSYFRIEKNYASYDNKLILHSSTNDAKVQGYWGTKSYHSFNNLSYVRFLSALDIINEKDENQTRWIAGVGMRPIINFLLGNKYFLSNQGKDVQLGFGYVYKHTVGNISVFENPNYVPFGACYDKVIPRSVFNKLDKTLVQNIYGAKDIALLKACVVEDEDLKKIALPIFNTDSLNPQNYPFEELIEDTKMLRKEIFEIQKFKNDHFIGRVNVRDSKKILFFSMPKDKGWTVKVDGKPAEILKVNIGFAGILLPPGEHKVEMIYNTPYFFNGIWISIITVLLFLIIICLYLYKNKDVKQE